MPIIIPDHYPHINSLLQKGVECISIEKAKKNSEQIVHIGIFNVMPEAEKYELSILNKLGHSPCYIKPVWIRAKDHKYKSSNKKHLEKYYQTFDEAIKSHTLNGLIITGAPVEFIDFTEVTYWNELLSIFDFSQQRIKSTLGICWGGLAVGKYLGIDKTVYTEKICGVYHTTNLNLNHTISGTLGASFNCPQSRCAGFNETDLKIATNNKTITSLAFAEGAGHYIIESTDSKFLGHVGHPEYDIDRIIFEYHRDQKLGLNNIPVNFDVKNPKDTWTETGIRFFNEWIKFIAE